MPNLGMDIALLDFLIFSGTEWGNEVSTVTHVEQCKLKGFTQHVCPKA